MLKSFLCALDSLRYTSALLVVLVVVFVVITAGITIIKLVNGSILMPRLFPNVTDMTSIWKLFTVVPVFVTMYICHYDGMEVMNLYVFMKHYSVLFDFVMIASILLKSSSKLREIFWLTLAMTVIKLKV